MPKIKLGPHTYQVRYCKKLQDNDGHDLYGQISEEEQEIRIERGLTKERERSSILHEVLHGLSYQYGIGMEEDAVVGLANGLIDTLDRNRWFKKKMLEE